MCENDVLSDFQIDSFQLQFYHFLVFVILMSQGTTALPITFVVYNFLSLSSWIYLMTSLTQRVIRRV